MKKRILACLLTAAMAVSLAACGAEDKAADTKAESAETENTEAEVNADGTVDDNTFTVGFDAEFPPYGYKDESGEYVGFDLDLAAEVCERLGWELVKQPINWDAKDMELESGTIDCIWNGFTINGREDFYTWTVPYVDNSQVFVVADGSGIESQDDLAGKVVGVQKGSSALTALEDEANEELKKSFGSMNQYDDYNTAFMDLEAGAIDALAMDIGVANYHINQRGGGFTIVEEQLATEQYGIGFLRGNTALKDLVEGALMDMVEDGTFMEIAEKYADYGLVDSVCLGK